MDIHSYQDLHYKPSHLNLHSKRLQTAIFENFELNKYDKQRIF